MDFFKRNALIFVYTLIWMVMLLFVLQQIDKQYYQNAKREIITRESYKYLKAPVSGQGLDDFYRLAFNVLRTRGEEIRDTDLEELAKQAERLLDGPNIIWRIVVTQDAHQAAAPDAPGTPAGPNREILNIARYDKLRRHNKFANSLFLRDFSRTMAQDIREEEAGRPIGYLLIYYTTPLNDPEIEELTTLYRWYCVFIVVAALLLAYVVARRLLFPIRNVTSAIEESSAARTFFIDHPHSRLEDLYNRMALDAVMARLHGQMRDEIARHPQVTGWEVVQFICRIFSDQFRPALSGCVELVAEGPGRLRATGQAALDSRAPFRAPRSELIEALERVMPRDGREADEFVLTDFKLPLEGALRLMPDPERSGIRYLFVLGRDARAEATETLAPPDLLERLADLVDAGLQGISLRNQILVQERGRANISLSRNLGHDLTNIIATSKLELMALDRLLGDGRPPEDARRRAILVESLHGLLRSVRFMQETVNLYRAYAFIQHPMMETHDGNELVNATLDLFSMSISAKVDLRRDLAPDAPRCVVDPRLIKLALFNLFANALEALRKADPEHISYGWIRVVTARSAAGGLSIAVEDSGAGIMNSQGKRAENHEIEKIFELGYTSRRANGGQGEGLGLNWVRTIVQDLHGGTIVAENIPDGGARFILTFPSLETVATRNAHPPEDEDA